MTSKKATDAKLTNLYRKTKSVWKVGVAVGMCGQSVHERLTKIGVIKKMNVLTEEDKDRLRREYQTHRLNGTLSELARQMGRTKPFICTHASRLGLTDKHGAKKWLRVWKGMSEEDARKHFEDFKRSSLLVGQWCKMKGFDDLGFSQTMKSYFPDEWDHVVESKCPKQTLYRLGRHLEYTVRDDLMKKKYFALRSPRSGGIVDILGTKTGVVLMIQCKRDLALGVSDWNELFELASSVGAIPLLAGRPTGRGVIYYRLIGKKDGSKRRQPMVPFEIP